MRSFIVFLVFLALIVVSGWAIYRVNTRNASKSNDVNPQINLSMATPTPTAVATVTPTATPSATAVAQAPKVTVPTGTDLPKTGGSPVGLLTLGGVVAAAGGVLSSHLRAKQAVKKAYSSR